MEFWGVEVKAGEPLIVEPEDEMVIHLSQACLGEADGKSKEPALIHVKVGDQKLVLGMLSSDKFPQLTFDLVFEKSFELSHNWKHGSIHFCGYQTAVGDMPEDEFGDIESGDSEDEDIALAKPAIENGVQKGEQAKAKSEAKSVKGETSEKTKAKAKVPAGDDDDSDDDEEDDSSDDGDSDDSDEDMLGGDDSDSDGDSEDESEEDTPTPKPAPSKKRANDSAAKTPVSSKKAKAESPKSDGKKVVGHVATPHPSKKGGKTPATPTATTTDKSKPQTPKSAGVSCKTCSKTFGSEKGLESHTKAKHA